MEIEEKIFENGKICSIMKRSETDYSVSVCDSEGLFDWEILKKVEGFKNGEVRCNSIEEVFRVLEFIKNL